MRVQRIGGHMGRPHGACVPGVLALYFSMRGVGGTCVRVAYARAAL